jgi:hypothetical protein
MDKLYQYSAEAGVVGLTSYALTYVLASNPGDSIGSGISVPLAVGVSSAVGSVVSQFAHDKVLPMLPQSEKFMSAETALLNAATSAGGCIGAAYVLDPNFAGQNMLNLAGLAIAGNAAGVYLNDAFVKPMLQKQAAPKRAASAF